MNSTTEESDGHHMSTASTGNMAHDETDLNPFGRPDSGRPQDSSELVSRRDDFNAHGPSALPQELSQEDGAEGNAIIFSSYNYNGPSDTRLPKTLNHPEAGRDLTREAGRSRQPQQHGLDRLEGHDYPEAGPSLHHHPDSFNGQEGPCLTPEAGAGQNNLDHRSRPKSSPAPVQVRVPQEYREGRNERRPHAKSFTGTAIGPQSLGWQLHHGDLGAAGTRKTLGQRLISGLKSAMAATGRALGPPSAPAPDTATNPIAAPHDAAPSRPASAPGNRLSSVRNSASTRQRPFQDPHLITTIEQSRSSSEYSTRQPVPTSVSRSALTTQQPAQAANSVPQQPSSALREPNPNSSHANSPDPAPTPAPKDPNEPLHWHIKHKVTTYSIICLFTFLANVNASCFTVAVRPLSTYFHQTNPKYATWLTNFNVLAFGLGNLFWVPLMRVVGKRPVYLLAMLVLLGANVWSNQSTSYGSLLASRVMSGLGAAAADATVPSVVFDMFHLYERAYWLAWFHVSLASGIFLGPAINASVIQRYEWWWIPGWMAIGFGVVFLLAVVGLKETTYDRTVERGDLLLIRKYGLMDWVKLDKGLTRNKCGRVFGKAFLDLLYMATYPQVLYAGIVVGVFVGWTIIVQITIGQWLTSPPYRWPIKRAGAFHVAGWIGSMFALWFGGYLLDRLVDHKATPKWLLPLKRRLKRGPPRRLVGLVIPAILAPPGLLIYGLLMAHKASWVGPAFGYLLHSFGFNTVGNVVVTYNVDCYRQMTAEAMVTLFIIRNIIAVIVSFLCNEWLAAVGAGAVSLQKYGVPGKKY